MMTKRFFLLIILVWLLTVCSLAVNNSNPINDEILHFLEKKGYITDDMRCNFGSCVYVCDMATNSKISDLEKYPFGIFKFHYIGCEDCGYYVLIKNNEKYTVYNQTELDIILKDILKLKKENPNWISNELFENYVEALSDIESGINSGRIVIVQKIGEIDYIYSR